MRRIFGAYAYEDGPRATCWWDETCDLPEGETSDLPGRVDVAIIGGGFTGVSAALHLAEAGVQVAVLEAHALGWGASGRNGGFCCLGGSKATDIELDAVYGKDARLEYRQGERAAVEHVSATIARLKLDVDRHSNGETEFAHRPKDMKALRRQCTAIKENYGVDAEVIEKEALSDRGMNAGPFFGAVSTPIGFGLNPRKYLAGLIRAAQSHGTRFHTQTVVTGVSHGASGLVVKTNRGTLKAEHVLVATNGYASDDLPKWLAGRYMPAQSSVLVTRPLTSAELSAQGWTTDQASFDTRQLLHYFRLMPDRRFLFGMRGGLMTGPNAERSARRRVRADFEKMFPAWAHVESPHAWSGFVCLAQKKLPFVGRIPDTHGVWASMCYHGNGVAMGSFAGRLVADMILGRDAAPCPRIMQRPLARFPLGSARRALMPPLYAKLLLEDAL